MIPALLDSTNLNTRQAKRMIGDDFLVLEESTAEIPFTLARD